MNTVLVAYGSKHGATAEIARKVGAVLMGAGLGVLVRPAGEVTDLRPYGAVVLGSAVYAGAWTREAAKFLERQAVALRERPVWLFSSGPTGPGDASEQLEGWRFPEALQALADHIRPRDIALFHGKIDPAELGLGERLVVRALSAGVGDFRQWDRIEAWALSIAAALQHLAPGHTEAGPAWVVQPARREL